MFRKINSRRKTKEAQYETIGVIKDVQVALTAEGGRLERQGESLLAKLNECCCQILRGQDSIKYDALEHENNIRRDIADSERRLTDLIRVDKIERLERELADVKLNQALSGVVRYPVSATYDAGAWPFGGGAARVAASTTAG